MEGNTLNTSSPTPTATTQDYGCPDWCHSDHAADARKPEDPIWHQGPSFGDFINVHRYDGATLASVQDPTGTADEMTAEDLRQLAEHAVQAATWIEGDR